MRASRLLMPTLREAPADAEITSHKLMLRAGIIRKSASGIYSFLPLGYRVLKKIEQIVREEMDGIGSQELLMPALLPSESYKASGRWDIFGEEMFRLKDRNGRDFCLGPTHEEVFTETVKYSTRSYRSLPLMLYQIQTKYRDEIRPRFGVMRSREFIMKDAYSFDRDESGLHITYSKMHDAYARIFDRCGLNYIIADADTGAMGGSGSQEFMVSSDIGEAVVAICDSCGYSANDEKAECTAQANAEKSNTGELPVESISTPGARTIEDLKAFFGCSAEAFAKTLIFNADGKIIAAMVRGDRELNEAKLKNCLGCSNLEMADAEAVMKVTNAEVGFAGPVELGIEVVADLEVAGMKNFITGANKTGYHLKNVNTGRDFKPAIIDDIRRISGGDLCPVCGGHISLTRSVEVGHIFKLGTKYSSRLGCVYLDEKGTENPMVMGCYGIGINRTMAAVVEQNNDENGIIWPVSIAPFHVAVILINRENEAQIQVAEKLYEELLHRGMDVILDDRDERAGVKFKDMDLIGIPVRITIGKKADRGIVEYKLRTGPEIMECEIYEAVDKAVSEIKAK